MKGGGVAGWKEIAKVATMAALKVGYWGDSPAVDWADRLVGGKAGPMDDSPAGGWVDRLVDETVG